jgi:hypothetical protein
VVGSPVRQGREASHKADPGDWQGACGAAHTHTYTRTYIHIHTYIHTHTHTRTYIHIHTYTHIRKDYTGAQKQLQRSVRKKKEKKIPVVETSEQAGLAADSRGCLVRGGPLVSGLRVGSRLFLLFPPLEATGSTPEGIPSRLRGHQKGTAGRGPGKGYAREGNGFGGNRARDMRACTLAPEVVLSAGICSWGLCVCVCVCARAHAWKLDA